MTGPANEKAGWCSMCRSDMHSMCASDSCTCPDRRRHRARPSFAGRDASVTPVNQNRKTSPSAPAKELTVAAAPKPPAVEPVIALVEETPPEPERKLSTVDQVLELVQESVLKGGTWYRAAVMPSARSAKALATRLSKHEVTGRMVLEWKAAGEKLYVRGPA
jgi:hypothetical protein